MHHNLPSNALINGVNDFCVFRTNLPKEIMAFPDFRFESSLPSFIGHEAVLQYLLDYADHFQVKDYIQVRTT